MSEKLNQLLQQEAILQKKLNAAYSPNPKDPDGPLLYNLNRVIKLNNDIDAIQKQIQDLDQLIAEINANTR